MRRIHPREEEEEEEEEEKFRLDSDDFGFIWAGVSNMVSYKTNVWYNLSCFVTNLLLFEHQQKTAR